MLAEVMDGGRITLPPALMDQLEWKSGDKLDMIVENGELRLRGVESLHNRDRHNSVTARPEPSTNNELRQHTDWAALFEEYSKSCPDDGKPLTNDDEVVEYIMKFRRGFREFLNARNA